MAAKRVLQITIALGIAAALVIICLWKGNRTRPSIDARSIADFHGVYLPATAYLLSAKEERARSLFEGGATRITLLCFGIPRDAFDETLKENRARHGRTGVREAVSSPLAEKAGWLKWRVNECYAHYINTNSDSAFVYLLRGRDQRTRVYREL